MNPEITASPGLVTSSPAMGGRLARGLAHIFFVVLALIASLMTLWAIAALHFDFRVAWLRSPLAAIYLVAVLAAWIWLTGRWLKLGITGAGFVLVLGWWLTLRPSNNRDWQPDVATLAYAETNGTQVTVHNIRNCDYRSETEFNVRVYDKVFDLERLSSADLYMVYWGSPNICHTMVSFGFDGGGYLCFSIETRKANGQGYSAIKGLFRQFELAYVVADERDLVRLRTNYRKGEEVYLFRLKASREQVRSLFLDYLRRLNALHEAPEWYSAVTHNCTTSIRNQRAASDRAPRDWRMLFNGHGDELLYERGAISTNLPLAELKERCHINERAKAAGDAPDFSELIRKGVPGI
ncbi:MAG TPA: DUF4105 domain-containing protein [Candidatus Dormibacteraeota bacterium]|nr:DUF4105 domain-containing protein [Candidatus Dormibacteraeota bacterium]